MPRLRLASRLLRPRPSATCSFQAVHPLSCFEPSSSEQISSSLFSGGRSPLGFLRPHIFPYDLTVAVAYYDAQRSQSFDNACFVRASGAHHEPVFWLKHFFAQGPPNRCLHSSAGVYSKDMIFEHDRIDWQWANSSSSKNPVLDPSLQEAEEVVSDHHEALGVEAEVNDEEFFDRYSISENSSSRSTLVYEEDEVITESYSSSTTSTDESDLSELEFEEICSQLEDRDGHFDARESQLEEEDTQWTASELEHEPLDASEEKQDASGLSEFELFEFFELVSTKDDSGEAVSKVSERHEDHNGRPYLHILSTDEVREILEKARAKDVSILQVRECCEWVDQLVFASGRSSRHLRGMADALVYKVKQRSENVGPNSFPTVEGRDGEQWMAVDCGSIVVHLFLEEARSYYNLEEFWRKKSNSKLYETF